MTEDFPSIRGRLHNKSHNYLFFALGHWERAKRNMFYGATDALLDTTQAAASYAKNISADNGGNLLACYGFLQALFIQQDAVSVISRSVGLDAWKPEDDKRLKEIRRLRNRLTGHPALAGERSAPSSAIIPYQEINVRGFRGHIYYETRSEVVHVEVAIFKRDNEDLLAKQLLTVEEKMDQLERQFRAERSSPPLASFFDKGFRYLVERLHCDLSDSDRVIVAQTHSKMIRLRIVDLEKALSVRGLEVAVRPMHIVLTGLELLDGIMEAGDSTQLAQDKFDLIYTGRNKTIFPGF